MASPLNSIISIGGNSPRCPHWSKCSSLSSASRPCRSPLSLALWRHVPGANRSSPLPAWPFRSSSRTFWRISEIITPCQAADYASGHWAGVDARKGSPVSTTKPRLRRCNRQDPGPHCTDRYSAEMNIVTTGEEGKSDEKSNGNDDAGGLRDMDAAGGGRRRRHR